MGLALLSGEAISADKYAVKVPGGLAFSEFRGFEDWTTVSVSQARGLFAVILANPVMIKAYRAGVPGNGKPFPDGSKMAKIHWKTQNLAEARDPATVSGALHDIDFMVRDSKGSRTPATGDMPSSTMTLQPTRSSRTGLGAGCGHACHSIVKDKEYVFSAYGKR